MAARIALPPETRPIVTVIAQSLSVDPEFFMRYLAAFVELRRRGIPAKIGELRRSTATQAKLYAQGRTTPGPIVTNAKPGQSYHESGKAGHIEVPYSARAVLGEVAEAAGLTWGGRWTDPKYHFGKDGDWQHVELR